jgi:hypothetical protein
MNKITLSYKRDVRETSSGCITIDKGGAEVETYFQLQTFQAMISKLCDELRAHPNAEVFIQRTDREGLVPYKLDQQTVTLIREDPIAAVEAMTLTQTLPSTAIKRARERNVPIVPVPIRIGLDIMSDAFGDDVYFRVRDHELECPGCGFWGMYTTLGLLKDPERAGEVFKTAFVCTKKCKARFIISCWEKWGSVSVEYLLKNTKLDVFYFPRPWNDGGSSGWIGRAALQYKFDQYNKEKESCSTIP